MLGHTKEVLGELSDKTMSFTFSMLQVPESERPVYDFEFTSGMFELNSDRQLVVRTESLDRDSPNQPVLTLQVRDKRLFMEKQTQEKSDFNARENSNGVVMRWSEICNLDNVQRPLPRLSFSRRAPHSTGFTAQ